MRFVKSPSINNLSDCLRGTAVSRVKAILPQRPVIVHRMLHGSCNDFIGHKIDLFEISARINNIQLMCQPPVTVVSPEPHRPPSFKAHRKTIRPRLKRTLQVSWREGDVLFGANQGQTVLPADWPMRLFWPVGMSCFEHLFSRDRAGIGERVLQLLAARTLEEADRHAEALKNARLRLPQRRVLGVLSEAEASAKSATWGEAAWIDEFRLRNIRSRRPPTPFEAEQTEWTSSLRWLGEHVSEFADLARDEEALRIFTTAVASASNYRTALRFLVTAPVEDLIPNPGASAWVKACALRTVLEGTTTPEAVRLLIPPSQNGEISASAGAWTPFKLGILHIIDKGSIGAMVVLLAEFVSTAFRNSLASQQRRIFHTPGEWLPFDRSFSPADVSNARSVLSRLAIGSWKAWDEARAMAMRKVTWVDLWAVDGHIRELLGSQASVLPYVYLNRPLLASALFALLGQYGSACTELSMCGSSDIWALPRDAVEFCIRNPGKKRDPQAFFFAPTLNDSTLRNLMAHLTSSIEPNVDLGTPIWAVEADRARWPLRLTRDGRMSLLLRLRTFLSRPDLREQLEPFMMLTVSGRVPFIRLFRQVSERAPSRKDTFWQDSFDQMIDSDTVRGIR